jgi:hypothetical protein
MLKRNGTKILPTKPQCSFQKENNCESNIIFIHKKPTTKNESLMLDDSTTFSILDNCSLSLKHKTILKKHTKNNNQFDINQNKKRKIKFKDEQNQNKPIAEIILVKSFRKLNSKNNYNSDKIKQNFENESQSEEDCQCFIF